MNLYRDETAPYAAVCGYERNSPFPGEKLTLAIAASVIIDPAVL